MKTTKKDKETPFDAYHEVRIVAAMTDEELRIALAQYGLEPFTRLPDVLQSLSTDNNRSLRSNALRWLCHLAKSLLMQPLTLGTATLSALLLACFGALTRQNLQAPTDSIPPIAISIPRPPEKQVIMIDGSGVGSRVMESKNQNRSTTPAKRRSGEVSSLISETHVTELPLNGSNYAKLASFVADTEPRNTDKSPLANPMAGGEELLEANISGRVGFPAHHERFLSVTAQKEDLAKVMAGGDANPPCAAP